MPWVYCMGYIWQINHFWLIIVYISEMHSKIQKYKNKCCEVFFRHILTYQAGTVSQNQKLEVIVQCLTWLVQFLGGKPIFTSKVWHMHPTSSPCCTARIATKLFPVHCHIINIKTLKYHFPTVCTWGVMQWLVNPIWSTILDFGSISGPKKG